MSTFLAFILGVVATLVIGTWWHKRALRTARALERERWWLQDAKLGGMTAKMNTPEARANVTALFEATPEEIGEAAVKAARKES